MKGIQFGDKVSFTTYYTGKAWYTNNKRELKFNTILPVEGIVIGQIQRREGRIRAGYLDEGPYSTQLVDITAVRMWKVATKMNKIYEVPKTNVSLCK
jgi:hypothetical protein